MYKLSCHDFGFDCTFTVHDEYDTAVENFIKHVQFNHGAEYSKRSFLDVLSKNKIPYTRKNKNELAKYDENYDEFRLEKWKIGSRNFP